MCSGFAHEQQQTIHAREKKDVSQENRTTLNCFCINYYPIWYHNSTNRSTHYFYLSLQSSFLILIPFPSPITSTMTTKRQVSSNKSLEDDLEAPLLVNVTPDDEDDDKVIEAKCNVLSRAYLAGIFCGIILQVVSFYASNMVKKSHLNVMTAFILYVFTKYWMPIALLLPAAVVAVRSRSLPGHVRLESFFESLRFQFGLFFGSLILLSMVNFYALAAAAPLPLLLAYYAVCLAVSLVALCLLQIFVNEVCANVTSIEVIVNYETNDESGSSN